MEGHSEECPVGIYAVELYIFVKKMINGSSDTFYGSWMALVWIALRNDD